MTAAPATIPTFPAEQCRFYPSNVFWLATAYRRDFNAYFSSLMVHFTWWLILVLWMVCVHSIVGCHAALMQTWSLRFNASYVIGSSHLTRLPRTKGHVITEVNYKRLETRRFVYRSIRRLPQEAMHEHTALTRCFILKLLHVNTMWGFHIDINIIDSFQKSYTFVHDSHYLHTFKLANS